MLAILYCRGTKGEYSASRLHWLPHALVRGICSTRAMNEKKKPITIENVQKRVLRFMLVSSLCVVKDVLICPQI